MPRTHCSDFCSQSFPTISVKKAFRVTNMAISFLMKAKNPAGQAARYMEFLADYEINLSHRKGASNANADGLSRILPCADGWGTMPAMSKNVSLVDTMLRSSKLGRTAVQKR